MFPGRSLLPAAACSTGFDRVMPAECHGSMGMHSRGLSVGLPVLVMPRSNKRVTWLMQVCTEVRRCALWPCFIVWLHADTRLWTSMTRCCRHTAFCRSRRKHSHLMTTNFRCTSTISIPLTIHNRICFDTGSLVCYPSFLCIQTFSTPALHLQPPSSLLLAVSVSMLIASVEAFQCLQLQGISLPDGRWFRVGDDERVVAVLPVQALLVNC